MYLIRERFFRLGEDSDITDEHGRPVLHVDGKVLSLRTGWSRVTPKGEKWPRSSAAGGNATPPRAGLARPMVRYSQPSTSGQAPGIGLFQA